MTTTIYNNLLYFLKYATATTFFVVGMRKVRIIIKLAVLQNIPNFINLSIFNFCLCVLLFFLGGGGGGGGVEWVGGCYQ